MTLWETQQDGVWVFVCVWVCQCNISQLLDQPQFPSTQWYSLGDRQSAFQELHLSLNRQLMWAHYRPLGPLVVGGGQRLQKASTARSETSWGQERHWPGKMEGKAVTLSPSTDSKWSGRGGLWTAFSLPATAQLSTWQCDYVCKCCRVLSHVECYTGFLEPAWDSGKNYFASKESTPRWEPPHW